MVVRRAGSQTAERAFDVLNCFKSGPSSLGLTQIARRVGLSTSIVHRLLQSLVAADLLEQDERTSQYRLGRGLASLSEVFFRQRRFDLVSGGACVRCKRILCAQHLHGSWIRRLIVDFGSAPICCDCRRESA